MNATADCSHPGMALSGCAIKKWKSKMISFLSPGFYWREGPATFNYDWGRRKWWHVAQLLSGLHASSLLFPYSLGKNTEFAMEHGLGMLFPLNGSKPAQFCCSLWMSYSFKIKALKPVLSLQKMALVCGTLTWLCSDG